MKSLLRPVVIICIGIIMFFLLQHQQETLAIVNDYIQTLDIRLAALLFLIVFALGSIILIPASVFMIAGGAWFGMYWGLALNMVGFAAGATLTFLVSRYMAHDFVQRHMPKRVVNFINRAHAHGWKLVAILRMSGVVPAAVANYALGLTSLKLPEYAVASTLFTLPIGTLLTYAGVAGQEFINGGSLDRLLLSLTVVVALAVIAYFLRIRYIRKQLRAKQNNDEPEI